MTVIFDVSKKYQKDFRIVKQPAALAARLFNRLAVLLAEQLVSFSLSNAHFKKTSGMGVNKRNWG